MSLPLKILVVEDSEDAAEALVTALRHLGFDPQWTRADNEAAFRAGLDAGPEVVFSEIELPQFSARRALQVLEATGIAAPLIIVSAASDQDAAWDWIKLGATDVLVKGIWERLGCAVQRALVERRLRRQKLRAEAAWRGSQGLVTLGQATHTVAHDFNNILTGIRCQAENVIAFETINPSVRAAMELVVNATERAAGLTRGLLDFARLRPLQAAPLDLNALITDLAPSLKQPAGHNIQVRLELTPELPLIHADDALLQKVLSTLATHAVGCMPEGGVLTIATNVFDADAAYVEQQPGARVGESVSLIVHDTGCGIAPELLPRIFEPFLKLSRSRVNTGLNLATVSGIVRQHWGWIEVTSQLGQGTAFRVCFPVRGDLSSSSPVISLADPAAIPVPGSEPRPEAGIPVGLESPPPDPPCLTGGNETVLVVDDELQVRNLVCNFLGALGYRVLSASSAGDALNLWQTHANSIELLITDAMLPDGPDGQELVRRLRAVKPALKAMLMSGDSEEILTAEPDSGPVIRFLAKPFDLLDLARLTRECLDEAPDLLAVPGKRPSQP